MKYAIAIATMLFVTVLERARFHSDGHELRMYLRAPEPPRYAFFNSAKWAARAAAPDDCRDPHCRECIKLDPRKPDNLYCIAPLQFVR